PGEVRGGTSGTPSPIDISRSFGAEETSPSSVVTAVGPLSRVPAAVLIGGVVAAGVFVLLLLVGRKTPIVGPSPLSPAESVAKAPEPIAPSAKLPSAVPRTFADAPPFAAASQKEPVLDAPSGSRTAPSATHAQQHERTVPPAPSEDPAGAPGTLQ